MRPGRVRTGWREPTAGVSLVAGQVAEGGGEEASTGDVLDHGFSRCG
ncbi:MAG: hypothetical protein ACPIOQ_13070 [Promethearchaeia archaeon]